MVHHNDYLNPMFSNAAALMDELAAETGKFTSQEFLKEVARRNPGPYIDFLYAVKNERGAQDAFNIVHQAIGLRLSTEAARAGFKKRKAGREETTIWDTDTDKVIYRRVG